MSETSSTTPPFEPNFQPTERMTNILELPLYGDDDRPSWRGHVNYTNYKIDKEVSVTRAQIGDMRTEVTGAINTSTTEINKKLNEQTAKVDSTLAAQNSSLTSKIDAQNERINTSITAQNERMNTSIAAQNAKVDTTLNTFSQSYAKADQITLDAVLNGLPTDGTSDVSAKFLELAKRAASKGLPLQLPAGTFNMCNVELPANVTIIGAGPATVLKHHPSYKGENDCVLFARDNNIRIEYLRVNGNLSSFSDVKSEHMHGINIGSSKTVTVVDVISEYNKGDGIYVGKGFDTKNPENVNLVRVKCRNNWRNNLSITDVDTFRAIGSYFTDAKGTTPESGVDIEPNYDGTRYTVRDVRFTDCTFSGNNQSGVAITLYEMAYQGIIRFVSCSMNNNKTNGVYWYGAKNVSLSDCDIFDNGWHGISFQANTFRNLDIINTRISNNGKHGIQCQPEIEAPPSPGNNAQPVTPTVNSVNVHGVRVYDNGTSNPGGYYGIIFANNTAKGVKNLSVKDSQVTNINGSNQNFGVYLSENCVNTIIADNDFSGNRSVGLVNYSDPETRIMRNNFGVPTIRAAVSDTVLENSMYKLLCLPTQQAIDVTLPAIPETDRIYTIYDGAGTASTNNIRIHVNNDHEAQGIGNDTVLTLNKDYQSVSMFYFSQRWIIV